MALLYLEQEKNLLEKCIKTGYYPKTLYKYRSVDSAKMILDNFSFWFAQPSSFNDPFDCSLSEVESYSLEDLQAYNKKLNLTSDVISNAEKDYLSDPDTFRKKIVERKENHINSYGVLSLSKVHDSILMWSHYAQEHMGIVFGLDMEKDLNFFLKPFNIEYQNEYEVSNYLKNPDLSINQTVKVKSLQWAYEEEVRVYKKEAGLKTITPRAISEIYFGVKTSEEDIQKIMSLCRKKGLNHISFLKGNKKHGEFRIDFTKI